eukprot:CAMPEP_0118867914 /NCGR_PEP_ID=MMETSP1163-20130328/11364_1 /TAXON_ID=124430 /ORGANISM="Phaeomonas parva, Strain CCMP2877" /LENGTH=382 /DNA_ID=CAMNT_0006802405 /DNA_START=128 /DNA_END=1272 /DNA_ORIENTATION=-
MAAAAAADAASRAALFEGLLEVCLLERGVAWPPGPHDEATDKRAALAPLEEPEPGAGVRSPGEEEEEEEADAAAAADYGDEARGPVRRRDTLLIGPEEDVVVEEAGEDGEDGFEDGFVVVGSPAAYVREQSELARLTPAERLDGLDGLLTWLVGRRVYSGRARAAMRRAAAIMGVAWLDVRLLECQLAAQEHLRGVQRPALDRGASLYGALSVTLAVLGGGLLLSYTGGVAASALAVTVAEAFGGYGAAAAVSAVTSVTSVTSVTGLFGAAGATMAGVKMHRRTRGIKDFRFLPLEGDPAAAAAAAAGDGGGGGGGGGGEEKKKQDKGGKPAKAGAADAAKPPLVDLKPPLGQEQRSLARFIVVSGVYPASLDPRAIFGGVG